VNSSAVGATSPRGGTQATASLKRDARRHSDAVSYSGDKAYFGLKEALKSSLETKLQAVSKLSDDLEVAIRAKDFKPASNFGEKRLEYIALADALSSSRTEADKVYYEGRSLHPYYIDLFGKIAAEQGRIAQLVKETRGMRYTPESEEPLTESKPSDPSSEEVAKQTAAKSFSEAATTGLHGDKAIAKAERLSWADMVEEELELLARQKSTETQQSLVTVIRSRTGINREPG
jgi:hypothetical protein